MSFDYIIKFLWLTNYFEKFPDPKGKNYPIEKYFRHASRADELIVVLPFWKSWTFANKLLNWRALRSGKSCLFYSFSPELLSSDPEYTLQEFHKIKAQVRQDISDLKKQYGYSKIKIIATSLGVVSAMMIADGNKDVDELLLIVPGSCLASSLWDGIRTQRLKKIYEQKGIDKEKLQKMWKELAPKNNVSQIEGKKIHVAISKSDKLIPYKYGKEFADILKEKGASIKESIFPGHYISIIQFYLFGKL